MKKRLIILSDLWGREKSEWIINYTQILENYFDIVYYDSCELGEIDKSKYTANNLHNQFINGGIEKAVERLSEIEKEKVNILAFSIGGTIAWKYGIKTDNIDALICVSSTRLRYEKSKPKGRLKLYLGSKDGHIPGKRWFENMQPNYEILTEQKHIFYAQPVFAEQISKYINENI